MNTKFLKNTIKTFNDNTERFFEKKYMRAWMSEIYCALRFGASPNDFYRYEFYKKSNYERSSFITYRKSQRIIHKYNDISKTKVLLDKALFNQHFRDFIGREWLDLRTASEEEFRRFVEKHKVVIVKPLFGGSGKGIFKLTAQELNDFQFENYRDYIAEELIEQHEKMKLLNPSSVNTIRIFTFRGNIVTCALRTGGTGAIVDNLHSNGVAGHLDEQTGIVDAPCMDAKFNKYIFHPATNLNLLGFEVPNWDKIKNAVRSAAALVPDVQYIGWDIAVTKDGVALIEGNHDPGHETVQMIVQKGLYTKIKEIEKSK